MALLNLLKSASIKWKLTLALIATGLVFILSYVLIAKNVFENDKISYVFDAQNSRLQSVKSEVESKLAMSLLAARSIVATYDPNLGRPNSAGQQIFKDEKNLMAIELWNQTAKQSVFRLEKVPSLLPPVAETFAKGVGEADLRLINKDTFLLSLKYDQGPRGTYQIRLAVLTKDLLPTPDMMNSIALLSDTSNTDMSILAVSDMRGLQPQTFLNVAKTRSSEGVEQTKLVTDNDHRFLMSQTEMKAYKLRLVSLTPEAEALGALNVLFTRSLIFLVLSFFALTIIALTLARLLTSGLKIITAWAEEIAEGTFDDRPKIQSQDEIGILAGAFGRMIREIQRLLLETREKARMEAELKTAAYVQEKLLPEQSSHAFNSIEVFGTVMTSSECGGDWWYYFQQGEYIYVAVADATGHGTPAALITAAARSIFSRIENENIPLLEMMRIWDHAVYSCSRQEVLMTGQLYRVHSKTGDVTFVNAGHEPPYLMRYKDYGGYEVDNVHMMASARIGDNIPSTLREQSFTLSPQDTLVIYTDGLFSIERPDGQVLSELRFGKKLAKKITFLKSAKEVSAATLEEFNTYRGDIPLPDDVSVVVIKRRATAN